MDYIHDKPDISKIVQAFIKVSVEMKRYEIGCELMIRFDSLRISSKIIFDILFTHLRDYPDLYDAKIYLIKCMYSIMDDKQAYNLFRILQKILDNQAEKSIFVHNINPVMLGLKLYRLLDDMKEQFDCPEHAVDLLKQKLQRILVNIVNVYFNL